MQDDLADLMARNMHLGSMQTPSHDVSMPPTPQVAPQSAPITYISQHYHHSSHQTPSVQLSEDMPTSTILQNAGVNTDALLPSQLQLFKNAQPDQQSRLIELWTIAPPTYGAQLVAGHMGNWPQSSLEMEEEAARQRWEKQELERLKNLSVLPSSQESPMNAEPYMSDGYGSNINGTTAPQEYRPATDPAYSREREWWHMAGDEEPMEHQYGMLQQMQMLHGFCGVSRDHMMI
ncbi:hypothetical protein H2198_006061 [Neophaeococcomyces mojaviensis]|uniref:Uncharacterized protein n=1 Tax=Neophaeococcomyces mojaviensis TaxID=3383035 RepID=A0ACC3A443_9EURO|nr:hypothetical protein H2198_006061 [Knufia sp. JES_112]